MRPRSSLWLASRLISLLAILILGLTTFIPAWSSHLIVDVHTYYNRATYLMDYGTARGMSGNEYQPGALIFFLLVGMPLALTHTFMTFVTSLFIANIMLGLLIAKVLEKMAGPTAVILFWCLSLALGPVVLYRFEYWVVLFVTLSYYWWTTNKRFLSLSALAFACLTKVYPILFLPFFVWQMWQKKGWHGVFSTLISFALSLTMLLIFYCLIWQPTLPELSNNIWFHGRKPVHIESLWGNGAALTLYWNTGSFGGVGGGYGIVGVPFISPSNASLLNWVWLCAVGTAYAYFFWRWRRKILPAQIHPFFLSGTLFLFLATSKTLAPQYFLWSLSFLPLIAWPEKQREQKSVLFIFFLIMCVFFLTQYIYPMMYTELIHGLSDAPPYAFLVFLVCLRNLATLTTAFVLLRKSTAVQMFRE